MTVKKLCTLCRGQDGAIWDHYFFRFHADGLCVVYDMEQLPADGTAAEELSRFYLDGIDRIIPHSNAVVFGREYYAPEDEFPLLYSNVYNNYARAEDPLIGVCCVYRLCRQGNVFTCTLVQLIRLELPDELWFSSPRRDDMRPYGNFVVDREKGILYAFTMRDADHTTRFFAFPLPKVREGSMDSAFEVRCVRLTKEDMLDYFDCEYHNFLQGACAHAGKIYCVEGFTLGRQGPPAPPALRVIDLARKCQIFWAEFADYGLTVEPECIDFWKDTCCYCDGHGDLYTLTFT